MSTDNGDGEAPRGPGRPLAPLYREEYPAIARKLCDLGATDADLAEAFEVSRRTIFNWRAEHPDFAEACKVGKDVADDRVERSLYQRACGYDYEAVKIFPPKTEGGAPVIVPYMEHVPAETAAIAFHLKNRRPKKWRDRHELTGKDGGPIATITAQMPLNEKVEAYAQLLLAEGDPGFDDEASPPNNPPGTTDES